MSHFLAKPLDKASDSNPASYETFFSKAERDELQETFELPREQTPIGVPGKSCESNLFLGFFFDGTRNNYAESDKAADRTHSNVARLFDAYPGQTIAPAVMLTPEVCWPDEDRYPNYFRVYTPGVGTPFDEVGDSGQRGNAIVSDGGSGAAFARWGQHRLVWALAQAPAGRECSARTHGDFR